MKPRFVELDSAGNPVKKPGMGTGWTIHPDDLTVHGGGCGDAFSGYMTARVQGLLGEPLEFSKPKAKRKRRKR